METFSALLALEVTGGFTRKGQWRGALMFSLIYAPEQTVQQPIETPVIWDAIVLIMTSL